MKTQKPDAKSTKYRLAEASFLFVVILAVAIGVGVKMNSGRANETVVPAVAADSDSAAQAVATAETDDAAAEVAAAEIAEITRIDQTAAQKPLYDAATPASLIYKDGETAYTGRKFGEAARIFSIYTERRPANAWGHYMHGLAQWKAGELDAAAAAFTRALAIKPDHVKSLVNLARVDLDQGRTEDALTSIENALAIDPSYADGYRVLGRVYHNLGRSEEAVTAYMSALARRGDDAWALNNLGLIYLEMDRPGNALAPLADAVRIDADQAVFQNNLGIALERNGYAPQAADAYARAVELNNYGKAVTSLARVDAWLDAAGDRDQPRIDLAALATSFADGLQVAVESTGDESASDQASIPVAGAADSTAATQPKPATVAVTGSGL